MWADGQWSRCQSTATEAPVPLCLSESCLCPCACHRCSCQVEKACPALDPCRGLMNQSQRSKSCCLVRGTELLRICSEMLVCLCTWRAPGVVRTSHRKEVGRIKAEDLASMGTGLWAELAGAHPWEEERPTVCHKGMEH